MWVKYHRVNIKLVLKFCITKIQDTSTPGHLSDKLWDRNGNEDIVDLLEYLIMSKLDQTRWIDAHFSKVELFHQGHL